jgi:hypothetical protein
MFFTITFAVAFGILLAQTPPMVIILILIIVGIIIGFVSIIPTIFFFLFGLIEAVIAPNIIYFFHEFYNTPLETTVMCAFVYFLGRFIYIHYNGCNITAESMKYVIHFK